MPKATAILFLATFILTFTETGQLLRLPLLVKHFFVHQEREGKSFAAFMAEHYAATHEDDGDEGEDQRLPFKSMLTNLSANYIPSVAFEFEAVKATHNHGKGSYRSPFNLSDYLPGIFRPPIAV